MYSGGLMPGRRVGLGVGKTVQCQEPKTGQQKVRRRSTLPILVYYLSMPLSVAKIAHNHCIPLLFFVLDNVCNKCLDYTQSKMFFIDIIYSFYLKLKVKTLDFTDCLNLVYFV